MTDKTIDFKELRKEMPYHWRVQSAKEFGTSLVAYIDARDVEDVLDKVCGPENWTNNYSMAGSQMVSNIGIFINGQWVYKADGGSASNIEKEKGLLSDSFKRSAVKWGIGRFLYRLSIIKLESIDTGRVKNGDKVYAPAHSIKKYGAVEDVPFGIMKYDFQLRRVGLQINDVNAYVNDFLKPWSEKQKKNK